MQTILCLLLFLSSLIVAAQTAVIKAQKIVYHIKDTSSLITFRINGCTFGESDTLIRIPLQAGFDSCEAFCDGKGISFLTKLKENETYVLQQGCCCAAFILRPEANARRGTLTFSNKTGRDVALIAAEANIDTVKANQTKMMFAFESAMCMFKPCSILLTETDYLKEVYEYKNDRRNYDSLWMEQARYILAQHSFHFLHGEKIEVVYNNVTGRIHLNLAGYLTDAEYKKIWE